MVPKTPSDTAPIRRDEVPGDLPAPVLAAGRPVQIAWYDFVDGQLANAHTRKAYSRALRRIVKDFSSIQDDGLGGTQPSASRPPQG